MPTDALTVYDGKKVGRKKGGRKITTEYDENVEEEILGKFAKCTIFIFEEIRKIRFWSFLDSFFGFLDHSYFPLFGVTRKGSYTSRTATQR